MEKRVTTLEVLMSQTAKSIDRLDRSIVDLRGDLNHSIKDLRLELNQSIGGLRRDMDRKFLWLIGIQLAGLAAMMGAIARLAQLL